MKKNNTITKTIDLTQPLSDEQKQRLTAVANLPDEQIDFSDIPYNPKAEWAKAVALPSSKQQVTLRLDKDVLDFFKKTGKGYQTRLNAVLRTYMEANQ